MTKRNDPCERAEIAHAFLRAIRTGINPGTPRKPKQMWTCPTHGTFILHIDPGCPDCKPVTNPPDDSEYAGTGGEQ